VRELDPNRQLDELAELADLLTQLSAASKDSSNALCVHKTAVVRQQRRILEDQTTAEPFGALSSSAGSLEKEAHTEQLQLDTLTGELLQTTADYSDKLAEQSAELFSLRQQVKAKQAQLDSLSTLSKETAVALSARGAVEGSAAHTAAGFAALPGPDSNSGSAAAPEATSELMCTPTPPVIVVAEPQPAVTHKSVLQGSAAAVPIPDDALQGVLSSVAVLLKSTMYHTGADFEQQKLTTSIQLSQHAKALSSELDQRRSDALAELQQLAQQPPSVKQAYDFRLAAQKHQVDGLVNFREVQAIAYKHRAAVQQGLSQGNAGQLPECEQGGVEGLEEQQVVSESEQGVVEGLGEQQVQSECEQGGAEWLGEQQQTLHEDTDIEEGGIPTSTQQDQHAHGKRAGSPPAGLPSLKRQHTDASTGAQRVAMSAVENIMHADASN
jgi:hypothetical protein